MEEKNSLLALLKKEFDCREIDIRTYSPLTLAFLGDCIYDLVIRTVVVERANTSPNTLHNKKSRLVKAETQAAMAEALADELTEEELAVYKRGRNAKSYSSAKNASITGINLKINEDLLLSVIKIVSSHISATRRCACRHKPTLPPPAYALALHSFRLKCHIRKRPKTNRPHPPYPPL